MKKATTEALPGSLGRLLLLLALMAPVLLSRCSSPPSQSVTIPANYLFDSQSEGYVLASNLIFFSEDSAELYISYPRAYGIEELVPGRYVSLRRKDVLVQNSVVYVPYSLVVLAGDSATIYSEASIPLRERVENTAEQTESSAFAYWLMAILLLFILLALLYYMGIVLWLRAKTSNVQLGLVQLTIMRFQRVPVDEVVDVMIKSTEASVPIPHRKLVAHFLAGGNIRRVADALIAAKNADEEMDTKLQLGLDFDTVANIDLAGVDVLQAVLDSINYQVLETSGITAYAEDGVQLTMKAKVTIRPRIRKIVGGAGPETILARVDEGIVTAIGSTASHYQVLRSPYEVAEKVVQNQEITENTAFELISVDISDIRVGKDIHAELEIERAQAAKQKAEARKLEALAREQEMKAKEQEAKVKFVDAQVEVQKAMAAAFLDGNLTVRQYQELQNLEADTRMRDFLGRSFEPKPPPQGPPDEHNKHNKE